MFVHRPVHRCGAWLVTTIEPIMWQPRRQRQEANFGTVRTRPALDSAALRRDHVHIMSANTFRLSLIHISEPTRPY